MSKLMDDAVINMPYEIAMSDDISRRQFYYRAQAVLKERDEALAKLAAMESQEPVAYAVFDSNGNIRIWCADPVQVDTLRQQYGEALQPLYAKPAPADSQQIAQFNQQELNIIRQWHNCVEDCNPKYLQSDGFDDNSVYQKVLALNSSATSYSQQSADSSESLREIIEREADQFFEWPSADKSHVTAVSTKLFAEHIATLYASPNRCPNHESEEK